MLNEKIQKAQHNKIKVKIQQVLLKYNNSPATDVKKKPVLKKRNITSKIKSIPLNIQKLLTLKKITLLKKWRLKNPVIKKKRKKPVSRQTLIKRFLLLKAKNQKSIKPFKKNPRWYTYWIRKPKRKRIVYKTSFFLKKKFVIKVSTKHLQPDHLYKSLWFSNFINKFTWKGKKEFAELVSFKILKKLKYKTKRNPFLVFYKTLKFIKPLISLRLKRIGKQIHKVPVPIGYARSFRVGLREFLQEIIKNQNQKARQTKRFDVRKWKRQKEYRIANRALNESFKVLNKRGSKLLDQRNLLYKDAFENRTSLHYRWE